MGLEESKELIDFDQREEITITNEETVRVGNHFITGFFPKYNRAIFITINKKRVCLVDLTTGEILLKKDVIQQYDRYAGSNGMVVIYRKYPYLSPVIYECGDDEFILSYNYTNSSFNHVHSLDTLEEVTKPFKSQSSTYQMLTLPSKKYRKVLSLGYSKRSRKFGEMVGSVHIFNLDECKIERELDHQKMKLRTKAVLSPGYENCIYLNIFEEERSSNPIKLINYETNTIIREFIMDRYMWFITPFKNNKNEECFCTGGNGRIIQCFNTVKGNKICEINVNLLVYGNDCNCNDSTPHQMWMVSNILFFRIRGKFTCLEIPRNIEEEVEQGVHLDAKKIIFKNKLFFHWSISKSKINVSRNRRMIRFFGESRKDMISYIDTIRLDGIKLETELDRLENIDLSERVSFLRDSKEIKDGVLSKKLFFSISLRNLKFVKVLKVCILL